MRLTLIVSLLFLGLTSMFCGCNKSPELVAPAVNGSTFSNPSEFFRANVDGKPWVGSGNITKVFNSSDSSVAITATSSDITITLNYSLKGGSQTNLTSVSLNKAGSSYTTVPISLDNVFTAPSFYVTFKSSNYFDFNSGSFSFQVYNADGNFLNVTSGSFFVKF